MLCCGRAQTMTICPHEKPLVAKEVNSVDEFFAVSTTLYTTRVDAWKATRVDARSRAWTRVDARRYALTSVDRCRQASTRVDARSFFTRRRVSTRTDAFAISIELKFLARRSASTIVYHVYRCDFWNTMYIRGLGEKSLGGFCLYLHVISFDYDSVNFLELLAWTFWPVGVTTLANPPNAHAWLCTI